MADIQQNFGTVGIAPLERPNPITRGFMRIVSAVEKLNLRFARHGNPCVYPVELFPWAQALEREAAAIGGELKAVLTRQDELPGFHEISTDVATISQDRGWKTFFLSGYGHVSARNTAACPRTWAACRNVPGLQAAMFSVLEPGKHLPPHRGPYNGVLRLHLGIVVPPAPDETLGIRVGTETHGWREGKALIFDDAFEHEAWNFTDRTRVVLFLDFAKPLRFPGNLLNWLLLHLAPFTPFIREGAVNHEAWEEKFYGKG